VRSVNEDLAFEGHTLFAVADGMGGHAGGEVAARTAIDTLYRGFAREPSVDGLVQAVHEANQAVWERSRADSSLRGMGTTLIVVALVTTDDGDRLAVANVGDSRAYRLHRGELGQLTVDHSVAEELVARGELSESEAAVHPHRHILTRALGVDPDVEVDVFELVPEQGDCFLLCSDGLSNEVPPHEMSRVLADTRDPKKAAQALVRMANESGGNDNITAVVLHVLVGEMSAEDGSGEAEQLAVLPSGAKAPLAPNGSALVGSSEKTVPEEARALPAIHEIPSSRRASPRLVTLRVVLFVLVLGGLGYVTWAVVRWYVDNSYFVGLNHGQVVIYEGRRGGFLGIDPKVVDRTGITLSTVSATDVGRTEVAPKLQAGVEESSRQMAVNYVCNLPELAPGAPPPQGVRCPPVVAPTTTTTTTTTTTSSPATTATPSALSVVPPSPHDQKLNAGSAMVLRLAA
jgi:protein phosphatase